MSPTPVSLSPDLQKLRREGYETEIREGHLLVHHVPYVTPSGEVAYGILVAVLTLNGDVTTTPADHIVHFTGELPSKVGGGGVPNLIQDPSTRVLTDSITINYSFSNKPEAGLPDYFQKMTWYIDILWGYAMQLDPTVTPKTFIVREDDDPDTVFEYADSASTKAEIVPIASKLKLGKVAIVGLGGTGSYILDLVAKTPVLEIHLFDGDTFLQHNAFRAPGAAHREDFLAMPFKVDYFAGRYAPMRRGIFPHPTFIDEDSVDQLREMDFVFLSAEGGPTKQLIIEMLEDADIPFIDVGMGVYRSDDSLAGVLAVTTSTPGNREHVWAKKRIDFSDTEGENDYDLNIQIADLNALNAALAVIKWKKLFGFYADLEHEHYAAYSVDGNHLLNEDQPEEPTE
jgi:hypothetical protein